MLKDVLKSKSNVDVVKLHKSGGVVPRNPKVRQKARSYKIRVKETFHLYHVFGDHHLCCGLHIQLVFCHIMHVKEPVFITSHRMNYHSPSPPDLVYCGTGHPFGGSFAYLMIFQIVSSD